MSLEEPQRQALRRFLELIGGDMDDLLELLEDYQAIAPDLAARINAAALAGNREELRVAAHTLKSNAKDFGAMELSSLCETIERESREGALADLCALAEDMLTAEAKARQALDSVSASDLED